MSFTEWTSGLLSLGVCLSLRALSLCCSVRVQEFKLHDMALKDHAAFRSAPSTGWHRTQAQGQGQASQPHGGKEEEREDDSQEKEPVAH